MGSAFHQLCPRYSGTLNPTAPTAISLKKTFTFLPLKRIAKIDTTTQNIKKSYLYKNVCLVKHKVTEFVQKKTESGQTEMYLLWGFVIIASILLFQTQHLA